MKRVGYLRMGALIMGIFINFLLMSLVLFPALTPISIAEKETSGSDTNIVKDLNEPEQTRADNDIWYIPVLKEIVDNRTFATAIIINGSGELRIRNSATFEIAQDFNFHRNITVKDNGTLRLQKGTLSSKKPLLVRLENNAKLILENASIFKARQIIAADHSMIQATSSKIVPGVGGLVINIKDNANLDLVGSSIESADLVSARESSTLKLKNSEIQSTKFDISCREITITSNKVFKDLKVDRVEYAYILGSAISNIDVISCGLMRISSGSTITNCRLHDIKEINIQGSTLDNVQIKEVDSTLSIKNSKNVTNVFVNNCTTLELEDTHINNFKLEHFSYNIKIIDSEIYQSSILPKNLIVHNSIFNCNRAQLDTLTRAEEFTAYNSSFNDYLRFSGNSKANLVNCSTSLDKPANAKNPPKVKVFDNALVNLYWWLDVSVIDAQNKPLPGATVTIYDFMFDNTITSAMSNYKGQIKFKLLGNTINKYGWKTPENNSYYMLGKYEKHSAENRGATFMEENKASSIKFESVNKKKEEQKPIIGTETFIGILIIIIVLVLLWLSISGRSKRNQSENSNKRTSKTSRTSKAKEPSNQRSAPPNINQKPYNSKPKGRKIRR